MNRKREPDDDSSGQSGGENSEGAPQAGRFSSQTGVRQKRTTMPWIPETSTGTKTRPPQARARASKQAERKQTLVGLKAKRSVPPPAEVTIVEVRDTVASPPPSGESKSSLSRGRRDTARVYVAVEEVGVRAVRIAEKALEISPRVIASRETIRRAPIDQRAAFVLAFIDGATTEEGLVDVTGLPLETVREILENLVKLKLITFGD